MRSRHAYSCHRPRRRATQYSRAPVTESKRCGVLDTPLSRSMTTNNDQARSAPLFYRPNSRSISQPSNPAAASGRTDVRVGVDLPAALAGEGALTGALACEAACTKFEKKPPACEPGNVATGTP